MDKRTKWRALGRDFPSNNIDAAHAYALGWMHARSKPDDFVVISWVFLTRSGAVSSVTPSHRLFANGRQESIPLLTA